MIKTPMGSTDLKLKATHFFLPKKLSANELCSAFTAFSAALIVGLFSRSWKSYKYKQEARYKFFN